MWETIERLLKERGLTKNKLATLAGINKNSLIDLKMGRKKSLKFEDVVKIADALEVSLDEFRKG
ncbi:TPA: helix-turn-helix domain-containing protein [Streptococcus suis]